MIVWGGFDDTDEWPAFGGRYDPESDTWTAMETDRAYSWRAEHTVVWTG